MLEVLSLKPQAFGLDISDLSLKIIKLRKKGKFYNLVSFGEKEIPSGLIEKGEIKNKEALIEIIKKAILEIRGEKLKTPFVVASLPEEKAFLQVIQMPKLEEKELKKAIKFEAENYIPYSPEEVYIDFQIVPPLYNHLDHLDVLIAALPKTIVDSYLFCLKKARLNPLVLEIESQAIARALIKDEISPFPILLIDIGATRTNFIIYSGFSLRFTSFLSFSSQNFTQAISENLKIEKEKAEELKIKYGMIKKQAPEIYSALLLLLKNLIKEIKKYLDFYLTHSSHEHLPPNQQGVERILLSGGGANLKGLPEFLSQELEIPVELGNPWVNILPQPLREVPQISFEKSLGYTTALGLALRAIKSQSLSDSIT